MNYQFIFDTSNQTSQMLRFQRVNQKVVFTLSAGFVIAKSDNESTSDVDDFKDYNGAVKTWVQKCEDEYPSLATPQRIVDFKNNVQKTFINNSAGTLNQTIAFSSAFSENLVYNHSDKLISLSAKASYNFPFAEFKFYSQGLNQFNKQIADF